MLHDYGNHTRNFRLMVTGAVDSAPVRVFDIRAGMPEPYREAGRRGGGGLLWNGDHAFTCMKYML
eukprot:gene7207-19216_t